MMTLLAIGFGCAACLLFIALCLVSVAYVEKERQWKDAVEALRLASRVSVPSIWIGTEPLATTMTTTVSPATKTHRCYGQES